MDKPDLEATLRSLEAIHRKIGQEIAALRLLQEQYGLGVFSGTIEIPPPYGKETKPDNEDPKPYALAVPAAQPDLLNPTKLNDEPHDDLPAEPKATKVRHTAPDMTFEDAKKAVLDGYILDHPGNEDRLLKTLVLRQLEGGLRGFKTPQLAAARLVGKALVEEAGMRASGKGYGDAKLCAVFKKYVKFDPVTSLRRSAS